MKKAAKEMIEPDYEKLGPLLTEFGQVIAADFGQLSDRAYAFVRGEENWAQYVVYVDEGAAVRKYFPDELFSTIKDIWRAENGKRAESLRWVYFEYDIQEGKFTVRFFYPEEIPPGTDPRDWENAGVTKRFGNKQVIEPDFPTEVDPPRP